MALKFGDPGYMEQDQGPKLYKITFTFLGLALLVIALRLFNRLYFLQNRRLHLAEWLVIISACLDIASCILIHYQIKTGMGKHIEYSRARPAMLQMSMKVGLAQNSVYQCLIGVIKMSILAQLRLLAVPGFQQTLLKYIIAFVIMFTLLTTFSAIFQCIPMSAAWNLVTFPKGCWNMMSMNFFTSTVNTILDLILFCLPIPIMMKLTMERKKKMVLIFTYGAGSLAIACSLIRLRNMIHFRGQGDFTYVACMVPIWGAIECNAGIICASFPFIMPMFKKFAGNVARSMTGSRSRQSISAPTLRLRQVEHKSWISPHKNGVETRESDSESSSPIMDAGADMKTCYITSHEPV